LRKPPAGSLPGRGSDRRAAARLRAELRARGPDTLECRRGRGCGRAPRAGPRAVRRRGAGRGWARPLPHGRPSPESAASGRGGRGLAPTLAAGSAPDPRRRV